VEEEDKNKKTKERRISNNSPAAGTNERKEEGKQRTSRAEECWANFLGPHSSCDRKQSI
jgi:hypothetical protein